MFNLVFHKNCATVQCTLQRLNHHLPKNLTERNHISSLNILFRYADIGSNFCTYISDRESPSVKGSDREETVEWWFKEQGHSTWGIHSGESSLLKSVCWSSCSKMTLLKLIQIIHTTWLKKKILIGSSTIDVIACFVPVKLGLCRIFYVQQISKVNV